MPRGTCPFCEHAGHVETKCRVLTERDTFCNCLPYGDPDLETMDDELRAQQMTTPKRIDILDHGYVELIETWGSDERIIESARMSTGKGFQGWGPRCSYCKTPMNKHSNTGTCYDRGEEPGDEKLLRYLWENRHATPFEMAGMTIEVKAPIMVFREWHRHRTQSYNEMSARYIPLPDENYVPTLDRIKQAGGSNKQAQGTVPLADDGRLNEWLHELNRSYMIAQQVYETGLALGVPKELARLPVPVGRYSRMRASANLRNWFQFFALRLPKNAQYEIRVAAEAAFRLASSAFPRSCGLFAEGQK